MAMMVPVTYYMYRNGVLVASGQMNGAISFSYDPPDASPATYEYFFAAQLPSGDGSSTIGPRSVEMVAYKR